MAWDIDAVKKHLELNKHKNNQVLGFAPLVVTKFGLTPTENPQGLFIDDLDEGMEGIN